MTVYIEYVLIDNFAIDYMLLKATFLLTGNRAGKGRLFLCSFIGALFSLLYPILNLSGILLTLLKVLFGLLLLFIALPSKGGKNYYVSACVFFGLTFALGGAIIGIFEILGLDYSSEYSIALMFLPAFVVISAITQVVKYVYRRKDIESRVVDCELKLKERSVKVRGFFDTGNGLYFEDSPVVVCDKKLFFKLFDGKFVGLKEMEYSTASGKSKMFVVKLTELRIYNGQEVNIYNNVTLGIAQCVGTGYDVILHPALGGNVNGFKNDETVKKVS